MASPTSAAQPQPDQTPDSCLESALTALTNDQFELAGSLATRGLQLLDRATFPENHQTRVELCVVAGEAAIGRIDLPAADSAFTDAEGILTTTHTDPVGLLNVRLYRAFIRDPKEVTQGVLDSAYTVALATIQDPASLPQPDQVRLINYTTKFGTRLLQLSDFSNAEEMLRIAYVTMRPLLSESSPLEGVDPPYVSASFAECCAQSGKLDDSIEAYEFCLATANTGGTDSLEFKIGIRGALAPVYIYAGRLLDASRALNTNGSQLGLKRLAGKQDVALAEASLALGNLHFRAMEIADAQVAFDEALRLCPDGESCQRIQAHLGRAAILKLKKEPLDAIDVLLDASGLVSSQAQNPFEVRLAGDLQLLMADTYIDNGELDEASTCLTKADAIFRTLNNHLCWRLAKNGTCMTQYLAGKVRNRSGEFQAALDSHLKDALETFEGLKGFKDPLVEARIRAEMGIGYQGSEEFVQGKRQLELALKILERIGLSEIHLLAYEVYGWLEEVCESLDQPSEGARYSEQAMAVINQIRIRNPVVDDEPGLAEILFPNQDGEEPEWGEPPSWS